MANYLLKIAIFFDTPLSFNALARDELLPRLVLALSMGEDFVILARVVLTQCQHVTDG